MNTNIDQNQIDENLVEAGMGICEPKFVSCLKLIYSGLLIYSGFSESSESVFSNKKRSKEILFLAKENYLKLIKQGKTSSNIKNEIQALLFASLGCSLARRSGNYIDSINETLKFLKSTNWSQDVLDICRDLMLNNDMPSIWFNESDSYLLNCLVDADLEFLVSDETDFFKSICHFMMENDFSYKHTRGLLLCLLKSKSVFKLEHNFALNDFAFSNLSSFIKMKESQMYDIQCGIILDKALNG